MKARGRRRKRRRQQCTNFQSMLSVNYTRSQTIPECSIRSCRRREDEASDLVDESNTNRAHMSVLIPTLLLVSSASIAPRRHHIGADPLRFSEPFASPLRIGAKTPLEAPKSQR